jgi:hypothetical protein
MVDAEIAAALLRHCEQWNIAERRIKKAEHVRGGEVVAAAIFELRYAGRKIVDAITLLSETNWTPTTEERQKILGLISDATEDCVKAKHDAIDAMLTFMAAWFQQTEERVGLSFLATCFPDYVNITALIIDVQEKTSISRGDRTKIRDQTYSQIEDEKFEKILELFERARTSEERIEKQIENEDVRRASEARKYRYSMIVGVLGLLLGIIGIWASVGPPK